MLRETQMLFREQRDQIAQRGTHQHQRNQYNVGNQHRRKQKSAVTGEENLEFIQANRTKYYLNKGYVKAPYEGLSPEVHLSPSKKINLVKNSEDEVQ